MGKKSKAAQAAQAALNPGLGQADELIETGEEHLAESRLPEALQCFSDAAAAAPTRQLAWYNQGIAAAELWQDLEAEQLEGGGRQLLETAVLAFRKIFELDTSRRSELRYLGAVAAGRLLVGAAELSENLGSDSTDCEGFATEASRHFEEAHRLVREWGHEDLGGAWGDWGRALALQMRRHIHSFPQAASSSSWSDVLVMLSDLCNEAASRFRAATEASVEVEGSDNEAMGDASTSDLHWMVLHVEHLTAFVSFAARGVSEAVAETQLEWLRRGLLAWQESVRLVLGVVDLSADSGQNWQHEALQGDVFTAGYHLLTAAAKNASPVHLAAVASNAAGVPESWRGLLGNFGSQGVLTVLMPLPPKSSVMASEVPEQSSVVTPAAEASEVHDGDLARLAEGAYGRALASPGVDRGEVGLSSGELELSLARRALSRGQDATTPLQAAAASLQLAARFGTREEKATAWYNLACAAALAERPAKAFEALRTGFQLVAPLAPSHRADWLRELSEDPDLKSLVQHPDWPRALQGL